MNNIILLEIPSAQPRSAGWGMMTHWCVRMVLAVALASAWNSRAGTCDPVQFEFKTRSGWSNLCAHPGYQLNPNDPIPFFLTLTEYRQTSSSNLNNWILTGSPDPDPAWGTGDDNRYSDTSDGTVEIRHLGQYESTTVSSVVLGPPCYITNIANGSGVEQYTHYTAQRATNYYYSSTPSEMEHDWLITANTWDGARSVSLINGGWYGIGVHTNRIYYEYDEYSEDTGCGLMLITNRGVDFDLIITTNEPASGSIGSGIVTVTPTSTSYAVITSTPYVNAGGTTWKTTGHNELSDYLSPAAIIGAVAALVGPPVATDPWQTGSGVCASSYVSPTAPSATVTWAQYRFRYYGEKGEQIILRWRVVTSDFGTTNITVVTNSAQVTGTGQWEYFPSEDGQVVGPPGIPGSICIEKLPSGGCGLTCTPGSFRPSINGSLFAIGLGMGNEEESAGRLDLPGGPPTAATATPGALELIQFTTGVTVLTNITSGAISQIRTPQALVMVTNVTTYSYELLVYSNATFSGGVYTPVGNVLVRYIIENPDASPTVFNRLRITAIEGGSTTVYDYEWSAVDQGWSLTTGNGLRTESNSSTTSAGIRTETYVIKDPQQGNAVIYREIVKYVTFAAPLGEVPIERRVGADANPLVTSYQYYTNTATDGTNYGKLKLVVNPGGGWERYEFLTDGRDSKIISGFLNADTNAAENLFRVIEFGYTPANTNLDSGLIASNTPRVTITKLLGSEISRSYTLLTGSAQIGIECQAPGAAWDTSGNLTNITRFYHTGPWSGRPWLDTNSLGTVNLYQYPTNTAGTERTNLVWSGVVDGSGTNFTDGTLGISVSGNLGQQLRHETRDVATGIVLSRAVYTNFDGFGRAQRVDHLDGTFETKNYACCGLESQTDRDGVVSSYFHDALKRVWMTTRDGISTTNAFDAADNTLATGRVGTNGSSIVQGSSHYDLAGRLTNSWDALGNPTLTSDTLNGSGQRVVTTTLPDGGTRIETYFMDGSLDRETGTANLGRRYEHGVSNVVGYGAMVWSKRIKLDVTGADTGEWVIQFSDALGRTVKTLYPDGAASTNFYNAKGQLWKAVDPDGVATLHTYNALGEEEYQVTDMDRDDVLDLGGAGATDRVRRVARDVVSAHGTNVFRTRVYELPEVASATELLVSTHETSVDGLQSWSTAYGLTNYSRTVFGGSGSRTVTNRAADGSFAVSQYQNGRVTSATRYDSIGAPLGGSVVDYDAHGRQWHLTDARNGATTFLYNNADQLVTNTTPDPDAAGPAPPQTTGTIHDLMGRPWKIQQPDGTWKTNVYALSGALAQASGSREYPVAYTKDHGGRMKTMKTWQNFAANTGTALTTWNYHTNRGWLVSKRYADNTGPDYTYTPAGRLALRTWARGIVTTYTNNNAGELQALRYSDGVTSGATNTFDRRGRVVEVGTSVAAVRRTFNDANQPTSESFTNGPLAGITVTNTFDPLLRRTNVAVWLNGALLFQHGYTFDPASRMVTATDGTNNATYAYLTNSPLVQSVTMRQGSTVRLTTTNGYDYLNRLTIKVSSNSVLPAPISYKYGYSHANQRTNRVDADGSYWLYGYDNLGQVNSGKRYWSDGTPVALQHREYAFDDIGNRKQTKTGGDATGANLRLSGYNVDSLNQYSSRSALGYAAIFGTAHSNATVTVNNTPTSRKADYFWKEIEVANSSAPVWLGVTNVGVRKNAGTGGTDVVTTNTGNILVPKYSQPFTHDLDGNLTGDSVWTNIWNGENRVTRSESPSTVPSGARQREDWTCLPDGRWIQQVISSWNGSVYVAVQTNKLVWDGQVLIAILDHANNVVASFLRGLDLSGTTQGAGGVGGLLAVSLGTNDTHFAAYDGNGSVMALVNAADGTESARYDYDPFGVLLRATGPMAKLNPIRFSTQFTSDVTRRIKYLFRDYEPDKGRFSSRDPLKSQHGHADYKFVRNSPLGLIDIQGLATYDFSTTVYYNAISFSASDIIIQSDIGYLIVTTPDLRPITDDPDGTDLQKVVCLLSRMGFKAPNITFPVHLAAWTAPDANGWTLSYGWFRRYRSSFLEHNQFTTVNRFTASRVAVTYWHEVKGHNIDGEDDGVAFDIRYEEPVISKIHALRSDRIYKGNDCAECFDDRGNSWRMVSAWDQILCECRIPKEP